MKTLCLSFALFMTFGLLSSAQDSIPTAITPSNNSGDLPYSTSIGSPIEHIDLASGNLIVNIPFVDIPGRRLNYGFGLLYDVRYWILKARSNGTNYWGIEQRNWLTKSTIGWTPSQGYATYSHGDAMCPQTNGQEGGTGTLYPGGGTRGDGYIFTDRSGLKHNFFVNLYQAGECTNSAYSPPSFDSSNYAGPSSGFDGWVASIDQSGTTLGVASPDGKYYSLGGISGGDAQFFSQGENFVNMAGEIDSRGNSQVLSPQGKDSVGRTPLTQSVSSNQIVYSFHDSDGVQRQYTVNLTNITLATTFGKGGGEDHETRQVVSSIVLPNGQQYSFSYDSYGDITQIVLPTGGVANYQWTTSSFGVVGRSVTQRTLTHDGVTDTWDLSYGSTSGNTQPTTTVTFPADPSGARHQEIYTYDGLQHLQRIQYFSNGSGTPLLQYDITYDTVRVNPIRQSPTNDLVRSITTTLENGLVSKRTFDYDLYAYPYQSLNCGDYGAVWNTCAILATNGGTIDGQQWSPSPPTYLPPPSMLSGTHGNVTTIQEYDWGAGAPGSLIRQTIRTYLHDSDPRYFQMAMGFIRNIANRVSTETIYDGASVCTGTGSWVGDANGTITPPPPCQANKLAQTTVIYDNGDPNTYGYHGEPTSVSRWSSGTGSTITTSYVYDSFGNTISVSDPLYTSTFVYGDATSSQASCPGTSGSNAYLISKKNALQQEQQYSYYQCTGKVASSRDANDIANGRVGTQYGYDWMGRLLSISYPDGGHQQTTYNDAARTIDAQTWIASGTTREILTQLDNLGREISTQLLSDPQGAITTAKSYDALGRVSVVWNPYRSTSDATYGKTQTYYDALSRKTSQVNPDGSTILWSYNGNVTTITDETGIRRELTKDVLSHLTFVRDLGTVAAATNLVTQYTYDPLGNLRNVNQQGTSSETARPRSFVYDSLSRLTSSTNPETGTITYSYLNNGALCAGDISLPCSKTDARGVTTHYVYDALNRLTSKYYSNDPSKTATSCYQYDGSSSQGSNANLVGRLVNEWTQSPSAGACAVSLPPNGFLARNSILAYDAMGRILREQQCHGGKCSAPVTSAMLYDLAGNTIGYSNGIGSIRLEQTYDAVGRLKAIRSSLYGPQYPGYPADLFSVGAYTPANAIQNMNLGPSINVNRTYDNRLRITGQTATHP